MQRSATGEIEPALEYRFGLLSAIALQLMQMVARKSVHMCSECKNPFIRSGGSNAERKPRADRDEFCDACRESGASNRRADARRRARDSRARKLWKRGASPEKIAAECNSKPKTIISLIEGWNAKAKTR
jgi:hypothetical protein